MQFDPNERKASGQTVRDVIVQAVGSGGRNVKITIWPEHGSAKIAKGDFVAAQGKFTQQNVNGKDYLNLSASDLFVNGALVKKSERGVDNPVEDVDDEDSPF